MISLFFLSCGTDSNLTIIKLNLLITNFKLQLGLRSISCSIKRMSEHYKTAFTNNEL